MKKEKFYAIILSGGSGNRFGSEIPKQFSRVNNKPILEYCIDNFHSHPHIEKIIIVSNPVFIAETKQITANYKKIVSIVEGGNSRGESSFIGLNELSKIVNTEENNYVLIQDAVRPNTRKNIIDNLISEVVENEVVSVGIPTTDTIYIIDERNSVQTIPDRSKLLNIQTPQAFKLSLIYDAYSTCEQNLRYKFTDDCSLVHHTFPNKKIKVVYGDPNNIKVTYPEDINSLQNILPRE